MVLVTLDIQEVVMQGAGGNSGGIGHFFIGSITALIFGIISSVRFSLRTMSSYDLIVILVLAIGGLGLFLRSLKAIDAKYS